MGTFLIIQSLFLIFKIMFTDAISWWITFAPSLVMVVGSLLLGIAVILIVVCS